MPQPPEASSGKRPSEMSEAELDPFRRWIGSYPLLRVMPLHTVPLNRDHYIAMAWPISRGVEPGARARPAAPFPAERRGLNPQMTALSDNPDTQLIELCRQLRANREE
jgi:hypothetical protein